MTGALKYEWMRIRTIASSYWMAGMAIFLTSAITFLLAVTVDGNDIDDLGLREVTTFIVLAGASIPVIPVMAAPFFAVIGAMSVGHEYRYGTNKATLTANPDRVALLTAKLLVLLLWVVATVVAMLLLNFAITWLFVSDPEFGGHMVRPLLNYIGYCCAFATAGFGLAALLRNQTGAIVGVLVYPLVAEPVLYGIMAAVGDATSEGFGRLSNFLPAAAGRRSMFDPYEIFDGFGTIDTWGVGASVLTFWIGVLITLAAGVTSFLKRDA